MPGAQAAIGRRGWPDGEADHLHFHSLCVRILRRHITKLGYKKNFVIYDATEQLGVVRRILSQISLGSKKPDPYAVLSLISRWRNSNSDELIAEDQDLAALAKHLVATYQQTLKASNAVDFDDLILLVLRLFAECPEALDECRERYRYIMVDEYQDTNNSQFELVHSLAREASKLLRRGRRRPEHLRLARCRGGQFARSR